MGHTVENHRKRVAGEVTRQLYGRAVGDLHPTLLRGPGDPDLVGAARAAQPDARRRGFPEPPTGRHIPRIARTDRPARQPPVGGRGDVRLIAHPGRGEIESLQQSGVQAPGHDVVIGKDESQKVHIGTHPEDRGLGQGAV